jgi:hypothetical protein
VAASCDPVPQLDKDDCATSALTPYRPSGTYPSDAFSEVSLGRLGELPPDLFRLCMADLFLADVAALGRASRCMAMVLHNMSPSHELLLPLVQLAWTDDINITHVFRMLAAIETLPLPVRPEALCTVATMLLVTPRFPLPVQSTDVAWGEVITRTRELIYQKIAPVTRSRMLADLDVAAWHALDPYSSTTGVQLKANSWKRMQEMPIACWPAVLDAAVSQAGSLRWFDIKAIVGDETICFSGISDRVTIAFGKLPELHAGDRPMQEVMQTRFGVTASQYARLLRPMEAIRLADLQRNVNLGFSDFWECYPSSDVLLVALTERIALEDAFPIFWNTGSIPESLAFRLKRESGDIVAIEEAARWNAHFLAFFSSVESDACLSRENTMPGDASGQSLLNAVSSLAKKMRNGKWVEACLADLFTQPLAFQPVLLDRWASAFSKYDDNSIYVPLLTQISEWRAGAVQAFVLHNEYANAVRACVAELSAYVNITSENREAVAPILEIVTRQVFETMPSEAWGSMLSRLNSMQPHWSENLWVKADTLDRLHETFLRNPRARLRHDMPNFFMTLCENAAMIFDQLPDQDTESAGKFDNFCERLGTPIRRRQVVKQMMIIGIAERIPIDHPHLRTAIRTELKKTGLNDDESFRYVLLSRSR